METFLLIRDADISGVSGTGVVAEGTKFTDGAVALRWLGKHPTTALHENIESVEFVHGHGGLTRIVWQNA